MHWNLSKKVCVSLQGPIANAANTRLIYTDDFSFVPKGTSINTGFTWCQTQVACQKINSILTHSGFHPQDEKVACGFFSKFSIWAIGHNQNFIFRAFLFLVTFHSEALHSEEEKEQSGDSEGSKKEQHFI